MPKRGFKNTSSVTLRVFPGYNNSEPEFEVLKVSGDPSFIPLEELFTPEENVDGPSPVDDFETFDGYFPEDGYDYTQHLREIDPKRFLPAPGKSVVVNENASNPELAEVLAALEADDVGTFPEIEDTFAEKLGPVDERTRIGLLWGENQVDEYLSIPTDQLVAFQSRIAEREALRQQADRDEEFDHFFESEFTDARIGALSAQEVSVNKEEWELSSHEDSEGMSEPVSDDDEDDPEVIRRECAEQAKRLINGNVGLQASVLDIDDDLNDVVVVPVSNIPDWDCESVLSIRSNTYNHPGLIVRPRTVSSRAPAIETVAEESDSTETDSPLKSVSTFRKKGESTEEKRERKRAIKEFQREQRAAKKADEKTRREAINAVKRQVAVFKHNNYGDIPSGISKFAI
jgi:protein LTV1